ncbi:chalcone isomerase family protein [Diaphorobacter sp. ED-3]|uniref:chalcone isomerase family protein n=1 Tax=Diaphorobacter sp. ED-3 TaxID=3016636 RepID=UPI0022DE5EEC|nr:chalcone isomerase family protein [Diaphorobacter sp. ED-3]
MPFTRRRTLQWGALALLLCLALPAPASTEPTTAAGVKFEPTLDLGGSKLQLNGAGVRYKAVFKVYAAGLYLEKKASTPAEVYALRGPKRISVTMLRDIDSTELGKLFSRGMEDNMDKAAFSKLIPGVLRMSQIFSEHKKLMAGEQFVVDWLPGTGTQVTVKGVPQGEPFKEPEFFNALLGIWLGSQPADWKLKDALLGKE